MKKKILLTSILTIALCMSLIAGATFSLFTSESSVNIAVNSGKVDVVAKIDGNSVQTKQLNTDYADGVGGTFAQGVTVDAVNGVVTLEKFIPGDGVKFNIDIENNSTIDIKYKTNVACTAGDTALYDALEITVDGEQPTWLAWPLADAAQSKTVTVTIELPEEATAPQGAQADLAFTVQAVQGNANVTDDENTQYIFGASDLLSFAAAVNGGETFTGKTVELMSNIDLFGIDWTPIGTQSNPFAGTFDGNGNSISGIELDNSAQDPDYYGGLFIYLSGATVRDVTLDANIKTGGWAGILAGRADGATIENVTTNGSISGDGYAASVAGLCEYLYRTTVSSCFNYADVTSINVYDVTGEVISQYAAGIACEVNGSSITASNNAGAISATPAEGHAGGTYIGGIAAYIKNSSSLNGNTNTGAVKVTEGLYCEVGGIVGCVYFESVGAMTVENNINHGAVTAISNDTYAGGIAGTVYTVKESDSSYIANTVTVGGNTNTGEIEMTPSTSDLNAWGNAPAAGGVIGWVTTMNGSFVDGGNNTSATTPINHTPDRGGDVAQTIGIIISIS